MKKILIISYFFPPAGGGGVIRVAKFAKFLPFFGWQPYVLTVKRGFYPIRDQDLLREIQTKTEIRRVNYLEPGLWFRNRFWRSFLAYLLYPLILLPDNQILWFLPALWRAYRIIKKEKIKIVFTSASSYTDHLVAFFLKKLTGIKWVADFRDSWTKSHYLKFLTTLHKSIAKSLEILILKNADYVTTVSEGLTQSYRDILSESPEKFITITNGFDEEDFYNLKNIERKNKKFTIVHLGTFYGLRKSNLFRKALAKLPLKHIQVKFIGSDKRLTHKRALSELQKADLLLIILSPLDGPEVLTGKIFEYLAVRKPILALAPSNSGVAKLIKDLRVGEVCDPLNEEEIKIKILKMYQKWLASRRSGQKNELKVQQVNLEKYKRKNLTENLAKIFDNLTKKRKIRLCLIGNIQSAQNQNLCRYFIQKGYEIYFISTKKGEISGIKTYWLGENNFTPYYFLRSLRQTRRIISKINPDIIHGQDLVFGGIWAFLSGFHPYVVTMWGSDVMNYNSFIMPEKYLIKKTLEKADIVTGSSIALKDQGLKIGMNKHKFSLIHFGIDLDVFRPKKTERKRKMIFYPRAIGSVYNTDILIRAFAAIVKKEKDIKLALIENIADEKYFLVIKELIKNYNLTDKVLFLPKVQNKKMADYYNKAEVVISISSSDGCSVSFLEAMTCEKKIVVTDLPYIEEWLFDGAQSKKIGNNIWKVPVRDVEATAEVIIEAIKFPLSKWQKIGQYNRQLVAEKAEFKSNFDKLDKLYQDLI